MLFRSRRLEFSLTWRGAWLDFEIRRNRSIELLVSGLEGHEVDVGIFGREPRPVRTRTRYVSTWSGKDWGDFQEEGRG